MNYIYTVWVNQEPSKKFTSVNDALDFATNVVYCTDIVCDDFEMISNCWVRYNQEDFQSAEMLAGFALV